MKSSGKLLLAGILVGAAAAAPAREPKSRPEQNVILIGWDGVQREHLLDSLKAGKLPNLKALIDAGSLARIDITTGQTKTKAGWTEILTGCSAERWGITQRKYRPIPEGFTIFERLKKRFGPEGIKNLFIVGKVHHLSTIGPHHFCVNCRERVPASRRLAGFWNPLIYGVPTLDGKKPVWERRRGGLFHIAEKAMDASITDLGPANFVGEEALRLIEENRKNRFFAFIHFVEPDEQGHRAGENSPAYDKGLARADMWLGRIMGTLKELGIDKKTAIYVSSDHGMDEGRRGHETASRTFIASNSERRLKDGDRKDVTPTLLDAFGIPGKAPPMDGKSLLK